MHKCICTRCCSSRDQFFSLSYANTEQLVPISCTNKLWHRLVNLVYSIASGAKVATVTVTAKRLSSAEKSQLLALDTVTAASRL